MYEIIILFSDKPRSLDELISKTNYHYMVQIKTVIDKENYYSALGLRVSEFARNASSVSKTNIYLAELAVAVN